MTATAEQQIDEVLVGLSRKQLLRRRREITRELELIRLDRWCSVRVARLNRWWKSQFQASLWSVAFFGGGDR